MKKALLLIAAMLASLTAWADVDNRIATSSLEDDELEFYLIGDYNGWAMKPNSRWATTDCGTKL